MTFKKFTSIENSYSQGFIDIIKAEGYADEKFVAQEKAHGGNLSIWTDDGINFRTAKRTAFLEVDEKFYNHQLILENLKPKLMQLWKELNKNSPLSQMALYGEIIGGTYPHKDVPKTKGAIRVQKGVFYSPSNEFYAFDLLLNNKQYVNLDRLNTLLESNGFLYATTIFTGSLAEVLKYPNTFQSVISSQLGLPEIKDNNCEGVVIRTLNDVRLNNGQRILLKNKNEKWSEKEKATRRVKPIEVISEPVIELQQEIALYATENRLNNVISKIGNITKQDFGKLMGLLSTDVVDDFSKENIQKLSSLDKKEIKQVTKSINKKVMGLVKTKLGI